MDACSLRQKAFTLRSWLFPVYREEFKRVISLGLMMVLISFNFWILHISKDTLVISAEHSGAEIINFLKIPIFIVSIFLVMAFTWISNRLSQRTIFFIVVGVFSLFFLIFNYVLYPYQNFFHVMPPHRIAELKTLYPWFKWVFPVIGYWSYSLFYIMSELWGSLVLSLLFWQFANKMTTVEQSRRFYMLFGMFNGIGTIVSGLFVTHYKVSDVASSDVYGAKLHDLLLVFSVSCFFILWLYNWIHDSMLVGCDQKLKVSRGACSIRDETKLSFVESFRYVLTSRYVGYIALISIAYNISINFVEVTWKSQVKDLYQHSLAIENYFSTITIYVGVLVFFTGLLGSSFLKRFSWRCSSLITPILMIMTALLFFVVTFWQGSLGGIAYFLGTTPLALSVWAGQIHNLLSKSCKYSFFAATKEMAFIPLDAELKAKGKAAVDILSGRVGKFGGSVGQSILLSVPYLATQMAIAPYLLGFVVMIFFVWIASINLLNKEFLRVAYGSAPSDSHHLEKP